MDLGIFIILVAVFINAAAFGAYDKQVLEGVSKPNATTWLLWSVFMLLFSVSYTAMGKEWVDGLMPTMVTIGCATSFLLALALFLSGKASFSKPNKFDTAVLLIGFVACVVWWQAKSPKAANAIFQLASVVASIPTYLGLWADAGNEEPFPWALWALSYVVFAVAVLVRWQGNIVQFMYPFISIFMHSGIALLCWPYSRQKIKDFFASRRI